MRKAIKSSRAPKAIGPYSPAIKVAAGTMIFCSGQIPLDPETGTVVGKTAAEQCKQVMENLLGLLADAGVDFSTVVKTTIYLTDMNDFAAVNEVYGSYVEANPPARATVQVARLPKDVKVEIDAIAVV
ncbi:MAG TPA: RidA family protein [candidate division Zixibacteria bacterium]|nr:RidA family protein [candidate division Zixibacteria bacterium]